MYEQHMEHVCKRAEQQEREAAREMRKLAEARAIAGPEHVNAVDDEIVVVGETIMTDGGAQEQADQDDVDDALAELKDVDEEPVDVGDHVTDEQDPDATMIVVGLDTLRADVYELEEDLTVADVNPEYPADDDVVECVFPTRTDLDLQDKKRYAYPRSRLEMVARVHDRDENGGGE